ncbi:protein LBH-like [Brienomyrus brachyistius]|uniref:protein LBH-like n=1 Tax=Brienomyrus brachyistius TaxID=42636 RepID=UPI0020B3C674|nr:protein LBH-like [Brienomyrus brachyistius]XP_048856573.1 protein LBH-like [Brienomyrus brachyistius]
MTEVMRSCDSAMEDFSAAPGNQSISFQPPVDSPSRVQVFPDSHERYHKLSERLPSIVVEPTQGGDVESGELCWPPDDLSSTHFDPPALLQPPATGGELFPTAPEMDRPLGEDSD